ncbi:hypothetical protein A2U01_0081269, partial [Trifolium medium]|nr:hypothetical protein [Trifolium medium]
MEEEEVIIKDPKMQGKTRAEMGLNEFTDNGKKISEFKSNIYYRQS